MILEPKWDMPKYGITENMIRHAIGLKKPI